MSTGGGEMSSGNLTDKQVWIFEHGFYGHWFLFPPYNTKEYQRKFRECMNEYNSHWEDIDEPNV